MASHDSGKQGLSTARRGSETRVERTVTDEEVYETLRNIRRRYVIYYSKRRDGPVDVDELVDRIAAWETPSDHESVPSSRRKSVYNALHQTHLPKLEAVGLIVYDREKRHVEVTDRADRIEIYPPSETISWERSYGVLSALALTVAGLDKLGVFGGSPLDAVPWITVALLALVCLTVAYNYDRLRWRQRVRSSGPDVVFDAAEDG